MGQAMSKYLPEGTSSNYDRHPYLRLDGAHRLWAGASVWEELRKSTASIARPVIAIDTYPGVNLVELKSELAEFMPEFRLLNVEEAALPSSTIDAMISRELTDDRVFGVMSHRSLSEFYDLDKLEACTQLVENSDKPIIVFGWGALLLHRDFDCTVLADLPRWEIQRRQRAGASNWRGENGDEDSLRKVKRGYFVEWRVADRHKKRFFDSVDYILDTTISAAESKLVRGDTFRAGMRQAASQPFRVVPFFDPGVWGGQWMQEVVGLPENENYAWGFDCVPEENSIVFEIEGNYIELPAIDVVLVRPKELLGSLTFARFGAEFPIRFDFLDTMDGGNLSLQVHPLTEYIRDVFGMTYTQDESYYILEAGPEAVVYLGLKDDVEETEMARALTSAQSGHDGLEVDRFVNSFPARKHDHFLIPAGTVHCSGANSMVLEISATPYLFTFKMWDWGRVGLDGLPRPIHLDHALANIQWDRTTEWARDNLVNNVREVGQGPTWVEERTGLHELEFIEVRRHWFTGVVDHDTNGTVNVLNLVQGSEAIVESPAGDFDPFVVHYAETFIVPAAVGPYTIRPSDAAAGEELVTIKAYVRGTTTSDL